MKDLKGKVAVITGAASGIGRGLAERSVTEGMKVVIADVMQEVLSNAEKELKDRGGDVLAAKTDVSKADEVQRLADMTLDTYGAVHLLCNNAGVASGGLIREHSLADWQWIVGVNLWGVIHGVHTFLPIMLKQDTACHIVNTASVEGLWEKIGSAPYQVTKHGVVTLSEVLKMELAAESARVGVSVLCPAAVNTGMVDTSKSRPADLQNPPEDQPEITPETARQIARIRKGMAEGMDRSEAAGHVFRAIREGRFYILTHPQHNEHLRRHLEKRADWLLNDGVPEADLSDMIENEDGQLRISSIRWQNPNIMEAGTSMQDTDRKT